MSKRSNSQRIKPKIAPAAGPKVTFNRERMKPIPFAEVEERFRQIMQEPLGQAAEIGEADIVVGIPFYNEADTITHVLETAVMGLKEFYPDAKSVIVAAGSPAGKEALEAINSMRQPRNIGRIAFLLDDELLNGKGWSIRAIVEIADKLGADLVFLEADLRSRTRNGDVEGLAPEWIRLLLEPIKSGQMDMVVSRFNRYYLHTPVSNLTYPLFTAIYNCAIRRLTGGQWGIAHSLLKTYLQDTRYPWHAEISGYGVDALLATAAITSDARICEANLGIKIYRRSGAKAELVFRQVAKAIFDQIVDDAWWWEKAGEIHGLPLRKPLPSFGIPKAHKPDAVEVVPQSRIVRLQEGFRKFHRLYERVFPEEAYQQLKELAETDIRSFKFPVSLWAQTVYYLILAYAFNREFAKGDILNALIPLHHGVEVSNALVLQALKAKLEPVVPETEHLLYIESENQAEELVTEFLRQKPSFLARWEKMSEARKPPLPQVTYREFIPGVPLVVPTELTGVKGNIVTANGIYDSIFARQKEEFEHYVYERLQIPREASSLEISLAIKDFLHLVEREILPGNNLSTVKGTQRAIQAIFDQFPHEDGFALTSEAAFHILGQSPPSTLPTKLGYSNLNEVLQEYDPGNVLALARWTEDNEYLKALREFIVEEIHPEHFARCAIKFLVVRHEDLPSLVEMRDSSVLDKLTSRIVVSNLHKGMGGEFPKLRHFMTVAKNVVEAERLGKIWQRFAAQRKDFGRRIINSLEGHWGREPLSAHNIFEDGNQRILVQRLRQMANTIWNEADGEESKRQLAAKLAAVADSYHLALALPDGHFVTCSAWSWASYSFKGGRASPTPLSVHVERDWASREFLIEYFKAIGGTEEDVEEKIIELMGQGREWEDLAPILLGTKEEVEKVVLRKPVATAPKPSPAGTLPRFSGNPVLEPIKAHPWESKYVLNAGAIKLKGRFYLVYRAFGEDEISRLGLAISEDGFHFTQRLDKPIFEPKGKSDRKGCEDPRLTLIGERIYMTYTVFDGMVAQIALASIRVEDFLNHRWVAWRRHGLAFPRCTDKDGALFPEQFDGKFAMLHRVDPHIWITFSSHLRCPWSRKEHAILAGSTSGMMWDGHKIGAGAQPIKTEYGWLLITHGVDYDRVYRLGVMLLDLADPSRLIYRSPNPVLEPIEEWELGKDKASWKSNVVFTCGAVPRKDDREMIDAQDELIVYYGAADSVICAATPGIGDLIPKEFRQLSKGND